MEGTMSLVNIKTGSYVGLCPRDDGDMVKRVVPFPGAAYVTIEAAVCENCDYEIPCNGIEG
jgi:hypothetical protein